MRGKKVYFLRFLQPVDSSHANVGACTKIGHQAKSAPATSPSKVAQLHEEHVKIKNSVYPKSVSLGDLMKVGELVKPPKRLFYTWNSLMFKIVAGR